MKYYVEQQGKAMVLWAQKEPEESAPDWWQSTQDRISIFSIEWNQPWDWTEESLYEELRRIYGQSGNALLRDTIIAYFKQQREQRLDH